jgi:hypothetical protein
MEGYYEKYKVTYADGRPLPEGSVPFVLMIDRDKRAQMAAFEYAMEVGSDKPALATDLFQLIIDACGPIAVYSAENQEDGEPSGYLTTGEEVYDFQFEDRCEECDCTLGVI